jgi:hypothetical protein
MANVLMARTKIKSGALPNAHCHVAGEKHVEQVAALVRYLEAESLTDDCVPRRSEFGVHRLFD